MSNPAVQWVKSTSWEIPFFGLPEEIPWPADLEAAQASGAPFELEHLLRAIELLGAEATEPWKSFLAAAEHHEALADALEEREFEEALEALDKIDELFPDTAFVLYHRGQIARAGGGDEDAIELYKAAAERAPQVVPVWDNLGSLYALRGARDEAIAAFRRALELMPNDPVALEGLTTLRELVKLRSADPQQANTFRFVDVPTFQKMALAQVQAMTNSEQLLGYAEQLMRDGNAQEAAVRAVERASEIAPGDPRVMLTLSAAYRSTAQPEKSREVLTRFVQLYPQEAVGHYQLAQTLHALGDEAAEKIALDRVLELDRNSQPALAAKFRLAAGEHDPAVEDALATYGREHQAWMPYLLAGLVARERGDKAAVFRHTGAAFRIDPENEEVLVNHATAIGEMKELGMLTQVIKPAVDSGKYSKRLDWAYAHVLQQLNMATDAIAVLRNAAKDAPEDFQQMAHTTIEAWSGMVTGCGVRLETHAAGFLPRPILIALEDGDGGVLIEAGTRLPAEAKFPWRASGDKAAISLQQGESGAGKEPLDLGMFLARDVRAAGGAQATIDCHLIARPDGAIHFRATQADRKLQVTWTHYSGK